MPEIRFHIHASLNALLKDKASTLSTHHYRSKKNTTVKDAMESIGIPHTEVRLVIVNQQPGNLNQMLNEGDEVHLYPPHQHPPSEVEFLLPFRPETIKFVLDVHLSRLASYLRLGGFDSVYFHQDLGDDKLADLAASEQRILLTRDIGLLKRSIVQFGHWLRHTDPKLQLRELVELYALQQQFKPFSRCSLCNGAIQPVSKQSVLPELPASVQREQENFWQCLDCGKIYWKGSHYAKVLRIFEQAGAILQEKNKP